MSEQLHTDAGDEQVPVDNAWEASVGGEEEVKAEVGGDFEQQKAILEAFDVIKGAVDPNIETLYGHNQFTAEDVVQFAAEDVVRLQNEIDDFYSQLVYFSDGRHDAKRSEIRAFCERMVDRIVDLRNQQDQIIPNYNSNLEKWGEKAEVRKAVSYAADNKDLISKVFGALSEKYT
jgi:hypothetical protein